jgi:hypothetical protein
VDKVGLALLFPKTDVVLPSLWEQVNGDAGRNWAVRDADGSFVEWTAEMGFLWGAKDELPARGLVCVGKHVARVATCVAPRLVPTLVAASEPYEPESLEMELVEAITVEGPLTGPALRELTGAPKKDVDKAVVALHRRLVLTNSHLVEQDGPWGAIAHDLLARKWKVPKRLPPRRGTAGARAGLPGLRRRGNRGRPQPARVASEGGGRRPRRDRRRARRSRRLPHLEAALDGWSPAGAPADGGLDAAHLGPLGLERRHRYALRPTGPTCLIQAIPASTPPADQPSSLAL